MKKKTAIVLGGTIPHCELIRQLKDRGYYTILVDYYDNPPAKAFADMHIKESTLDEDKVLAIAQQYNADLTISGCVDQANKTACYVLEKMGKYSPYSYKKASDITVKSYMKRVMFESNIPTAKFISIEKTIDNEVIDNLGAYGLHYPVMIKPTDSNSANGVKKAQSKQELIKYLAEALEISRTSRALIEEYMTGTEISAYCYIHNHKAKLLMSAERICVIEGENKTIRNYVTIAPARISQTASQNAERIAGQIAQACEIDNTPFFFQGMVSGDEVKVIEFAPRVAGGISFRTIKDNTGFDDIEAVIDSYLGLEPPLDTWHEPNFVYTANTIYAYDCIFDHVEGTEELKSKGIVEDLLLAKTPGMQIDSHSDSSSRVGLFTVKGKDMNEVLDKLKVVYSTLKVIDEKGNDVLRRDIDLVSRHGKW
jgi:biotin carboxylase